MSRPLNISISTSQQASIPSAVTKATQVEVVFDQPGNGQHFLSMDTDGLQAVSDLK